MFDDHPAYNPIRDLLRDPHVTEIMINGPGLIYVERDGQMKPHSQTFRNEQQLYLLIERMLEPTGRAVSSATPFVDFRLPDGSRVNVTIPPVTLDGPMVTIRKFTQTVASVADLVRVGTLSDRMSQLLCAAVEGRLNLVFAGATGTGKTTTLGILSSYIPDSERIVTIEDTAELQLRQKNIVRLEVRHANLEGKGEVDMAHLVRNSLRMRPTRIIVGEVRGAESVDMIQAILSGHHGCLAVLHASSPEDAVSRLEMMALSRGLEMPLWALRKQIAAAVDLIVQHEFRPDGSRKVTRLTEVAGMDGEQIALRDLFEYRPTGHDADGHETGNWTCLGVRPAFLAKCARYGVTIPDELFAPGAD